MKIVFIFSILLFISCGYFQQKTYTYPGTAQRDYELCLKANLEKGVAGGNVLHCQEIQDDFTTAGRQRNFEKCFQYFVTNREKLEKIHPEYNCFKNIYNSERAKQ
jgi:hypothetical protein